jgi:formimidoylglutamase
VTPTEIYATARPDRFARTIRTDSPEGCKIALLGLPDDTGVALNGGRVGARDGPRAFREALAKYGTTTYVADTSIRRPRYIELESVGVFDAGDVNPAAGKSAAAMEKTHDRVTEGVREILELDLLPICIGGGHDLTWPAVRAVAEKYPDFAGVYFDAHLDVREEPGSGMAFRKILKETTCKELLVVGLDEFANSKAQLSWFLKNGGRVNPRNSVWAERFQSQWLFASFDLDVVNCSAAPGVSAINPAGVDAEAAARNARWAGNLGGIRYFDIMELNPKYDIDGRTARLAARLFLSFLAGYAMRHSH